MTCYIFSDYMRSPCNSNPVQIGLEGIIRKLAVLNVPVKAAYSSNERHEETPLQSNLPLLRIIIIWAVYCGYITLWLMRGRPLDN